MQIKNRLAERRSSFRCRRHSDEIDCVVNSTDQFVLIEIYIAIRFDGSAYRF